MNLLSSKSLTLKIKKQLELGKSRVSAIWPFLLLGQGASEGYLELLAHDSNKSIYTLNLTTYPPNVVQEFITLNNHS